MQALYQLDVQGPELLKFLQEFFAEQELDDEVRQLAWKWTKGTWEHLDQCDKRIRQACIRWQFSRLAPVDKSILRLATFQLEFCPDIPPKVVINEAIELAKKFSGDKSPAFVNGVLDAVLHQLHAQGQQAENPKVTD